MIASIKNNHIVILLLCLVGIFFVNLDAIFVNIMEARNFITAREMLQDGHWILTTLNGEPRYQKPPLPTWLTAFSAALFGLKNLIALRLPAALVTVLLILTSYKLSFKLTGNKIYSLLSSLILATSFYIVFAGRNGQWDIFTHGFMIVSIYQLFLFFKNDEKLYIRAFIASVFFGMSFMSKGPVSLYALWLPFLISFGIVYKYKNFKKRILPLALFLVISLLLSSWWHWYTYTYDPEAVLAITKKETSNWTGYNVRPFYYYWSFFTQSGVWTLPAFIGLLYPYLKNKVSNKKAYAFTLIWTLASVVLLSIIPEKKSRYLLPVLIPLALNTGFYIEYLFNHFSELKNKKETFPVYFNFGLIASIGILFPFGGYLFLKDTADVNWIWFALLSFSLCNIGIYIFRNLFRKKIQPVFYLTVAFIISIMCFGMPLAKNLSVNPDYKSLSQLNDWQAKLQVEVFEFNSFTPEMIWEYGKPIKVLKNNGKRELPSEQKFGVLVTEEQQENFKKAYENYSVEKITRYDMNPKEPGSKSHRPRLWRDLYLVSFNKPSL